MDGKYFPLMGLRKKPLDEFADSPGIPGRGDRDTNAYWWKPAERKWLRLLIQAVFLLIAIAVTVLIALFTGGILWQWSSAKYFARLLAIPAVLAGIVIVVAGQALVAALLAPKPPRSGVSRSTSSGPGRHNWPTAE